MGLRLGRNQIETQDDEWICIEPSTDVVIDTMLDVLDYTKWVHNIFALKRRIRERPKVRVKRAPASAPVASTQTIEVTVPAGVGPGQMVTVEHSGSQYQLAVPDGVGPGMVFQASVMLPS